MRRQNILAALIVLLASGALVSACSGGQGDAPRGSTNPTQAQTITVSDSNQAGPLFAEYDSSRLSSMSGQLADDFQTVGELSKSAKLVIVGKAVSSDNRPYQNIPFTLVTIEVERVLQGDVNVGDQLQIVETGGVFAGQSKTGDAGQAVEAAFEGVPVMKEGERWLLFLTQYDPGPVAKDAYSVLGVFQGKARIGDTGKIIFTGDPATFDDAMFTVPRSLNGLTEADAVAKVQSSLGAR